MHRNTTASITFAIVVVLAACSAMADVAPIPPRVEGVPLKYSVDRDAPVSRLVIPRDHLALAGFGEQAPQPILSISTIIAGLALSAAFASLVLKRGRRRMTKVAAAATVLAGAVFVAVQIAEANTPIDDYRSKRERVPRPDTGTVVIEIVDKGDNVQFVHAGRGISTYK